MEQKVTIPQKKLSWRRFIPMMIICAVAIVGICFKDSTKTTVCIVANVIQTSYRSSIINALGIIIGISHFYYVGRHNEKDSIHIRLFTGLFTSIATAIGYAYIMNSGLNFAVGIVNDVFLSKPFFVDNTHVDYVPMALITIFIIIVSGYLLWKLAEESIYEIVNPSSAAEGISNNQKE